MLDEKILEGIPEEKVNLIKESVYSLVEAEKNKGIEEKRKVNSEAEGLRKRFKTLESSIIDAGIVIPEIEKDGKKMFDYESLSSVLKESIKAKEKNPQNENEIQNLRNQLKEFSVFKQKYEETTEKVKKKTLESELSKAFNDDSGNSKIFGKEEVVKNLIYEGLVDLDESEKLIWKKGENSVSLEEGIKAFLEERKDLVKTNVKTGSGGGGTGGKTTNDRQAMRDANLKASRGF
jgi:Mn-dependent DtxR family transcriptional regulator